MEKLFEAIERFRILYLNADNLMADLKELRLNHPEKNRISIEDAERGNKKNIQRLKFQSNEIPYNLYYQAINDLRNINKYDKEARAEWYNEITPKIEAVMTLYNDLVKKYNVYHVDNITDKYRDFFEASKGFRELHNYYFNLKQVKDPPPEQTKTFPEYLNHDNKETLAEALKSKFQGRFKARDINIRVALFIYALRDRKLIDLEIMTPLFEALKDFFNIDKGTIQNVQKHIDYNYELPVNFKDDQKGEYIRDIQNILNNL